MGKHVWLPVAAAGLIVTGALVGCTKTGAALTGAAVRIAVDELGTVRLEDEGIDVDAGGLDCRTPDGEVRDRVSVTCTGQTGDERKIKITGSVTEESGDCVRGDLTAVVGDSTVFDVHLLGDCPK